MIYDHRSYTCKPGTIKKQLAIYREYGMKPQTRHLGKPVFYGMAESGRLNTYIHIWGYQDAADRAARRAAMEADPDWQLFLRKSAEAGNLVTQETCLMISPDFFPDMV